MKKFSFISLVLCFCASVFAQQSFQVNQINRRGENKAIYYRITSNEVPTVAVSCRGDSATHYAREYAGDIVIPATVTSPATATPPSTVFQVTSIDALAFLDNTTLDSILLPSSITFIDSMAFFGCTALKYCTMPSTINFIGARAFENCGLLEIKLPENITKISPRTFRNCRSLKYVTIPDGVNIIGDYAFFSCIALDSVNLSGAIGNYAFNNCLALRTINLSSSVTRVGNFAFLGCFNLNAFNVHPDNPILMSEDGILYSHLQDTVLLYPARKEGTEFTIPNSVKHIGDYSFAYNLFLKKININDGVTKIGTASFYNSTGLSIVNIPKSATYINQGAFYNCRNLDTIKIEAPTPPAFEEFSFYNVPNSVAILVGCDFVENYQDSQWGEYFTNFKGYNCPGDIVSVSNIEYQKELDIFPNPVKDNLFINVNDKIERVEVYSINGSLLISENNFTNSISMVNIPQGIYFVKILTDKALIIRKIIKK